jgi:hypothetical protein
VRAVAVTAVALLATSFGLAGGYWLAEQDVPGPWAGRSGNAEGQAVYRDGYRLTGAALG